ncbi:YbeD family protein [Andreprevotia chitinilytica]|uniref:YbeD family protein n=1 Tax=Andreprevotia chitinilytica TaxID=396808 RepID=UPI00055610F3|nr:DUF493 domain-containing protein [Andreprevotia chitinilytica]
MTKPVFNDIPSKPLEELVTFPVELPIKAISNKNVPQAEFEAAILALTLQHVPGFNPNLLTSKASTGGNYFAATMMVTFDSADQVRAYDAALRASPLVRMVL